MVAAVVVVAVVVVEATVVSDVGAVDVAEVLASVATEVVVAEVVGSVTAEAVVEAVVTSTGSDASGADGAADVLLSASDADAVGVVADGISEVSPPVQAVRLKIIVAHKKAEIILVFIKILSVFRCCYSFSSSKLSTETGCTGLSQSLLSRHSRRASI